MHTNPPILRVWGGAKGAAFLMGSKATLTIEQQEHKSLHQHASSPTHHNHFYSTACLRECYSQGDVQDENN